MSRLWQALTPPVGWGQAKDLLVPRLPARAPAAAANALQPVDPRQLRVLQAATTGPHPTVNPNGNLAAASHAAGPPASSGAAGARGPDPRVCAPVAVDPRSRDPRLQAQAGAPVAVAPVDPRQAPQAAGGSRPGFHPGPPGLGLSQPAEAVSGNLRKPADPRQAMPAAGRGSVAMAVDPRQVGELAAQGTLGPQAHGDVRRPADPRQGSLTADMPRPSAAAPAPAPVPPAGQRGAPPGPPVRLPGAEKGAGQGQGPQGEPPPMTTLAQPAPQLHKQSVQLAGGGVASRSGPGRVDGEASGAGRDPRLGSGLGSGQGSRAPSRRGEQPAKRRAEAVPASQRSPRGERGQAGKRARIAPQGSPRAASGAGRDPAERASLHPSVASERLPPPVRLPAPPQLPAMHAPSPVTLPPPPPPLVPPEQLPPHLRTAPPGSNPNPNPAEISPTPLPVLAPLPLPRPQLGPLNPSDPVMGKPSKLQPPQQPLRKERPQQPARGPDGQSPAKAPPIRLPRPDRVADTQAGHGPSPNPSPARQDGGTRSQRPAAAPQAVAAAQRSLPVTLARPEPAGGPLGLTLTELLTGRAGLPRDVGHPQLATSDHKEALRRIRDRKRSRPAATSAAAMAGSAAAAAPLPAPVTLPPPPPLQGRASDTGQPPEAAGAYPVTQASGGVQLQGGAVQFGQQPPQAPEPAPWQGAVQPQLQQQPQAEPGHGVGAWQRGPLPGGQPQQEPAQLPGQRDPGLPGPPWQGVPPPAQQHAGPPCQGVNQGPPQDFMPQYLRPQDFRPEDAQPQGFAQHGFGQHAGPAGRAQEVQGFAPQNLRPEGGQPQGFRQQGFGQQDIRPEGVRLQGSEQQGFWQQQGFGQQGFQPQDVGLEGVRLQGPEQQSSRQQGSGPAQELLLPPEAAQAVLRAIGTGLNQSAAVNASHSYGRVPHGADASRMGLLKALEAELLHALAAQGGAGGPGSGETLGGHPGWAQPADSQVWAGAQQPWAGQHPNPMLQPQACDQPAGGQTVWGPQQPGGEQEWAGGLHSAGAAQPVGFGSGQGPQQLAPAWAAQQGHWGGGARPALCLWGQPSRA